MNLPEPFYRELLTFALLINEKIRKQFEDTYRDDLTTAQFYMLMAILNGGRMNMSALARKLGMQKQQATKIANQLSAMQLIERGYHETDRRVILIDLTPEGRQYMTRYTLDNFRRISLSFASLPEEEFRQLHEAIETCNRILPHVAVKETPGEE